MKKVIHVNKVSGNEWNCFYWNVTPGHIAKCYNIRLIWGWLVATSGMFWGRHIWCRIFRRIFWYHSLVPQHFFKGVIQDLGPFFGISFLAHNSKTTHFCDMVPILSSHFFSISYQVAFHFFGRLRFFENFLYYCNSVSPFFWIFDAVRRIFVLEKNRC